MRQHGIQVLLWENKTDLIRALLVLRAVLSDFPDAPVLLPSDPAGLQRFSIHLYEDVNQASPARRFLLIPQASTESLGSWLNGWRQRLSDSPGTIIVIRRADYAALCRKAPDLMSFAHSDVHEATGLLPLIARDTFTTEVSKKLPDKWYEQLDTLPGEMPDHEEIANWTMKLESQAE